MKRFLVIVIILSILPFITGQAKWEDKGYETVKLIEQVLKDADVDPEVWKHVVAVCGAETVWASNEIGDDGTSFGMCQIQMRTAEWLGYEGSKYGLLEVRMNILIATKYLIWCRARMKGDWPLAYACYNRGNSWVKRRSLKRVLRLPYIKEVVKCYIIIKCRVKLKGE